MHNSSANHVIAKDKTRIVVLCATHRGLLFLQKLKNLSPESDLIVFSFRETSFEPPFLDKIRAFTMDVGGHFHEARHPGNERWNELWESTPIDLVFAVSWRYMIPENFYQRARLGAFVFHDSFLPEYRGFSPTVWSIINGEDHTGVSLFQMSEGVDAGDIVDQRKVPIGKSDTIKEVMERVNQMYLNLLERNLPSLISGTAPRIPQDHSRATYTCRRLPEDNQIEWAQSSSRIYNLIRGVSQPYSGAFTYLHQQKLQVWAAELIPDLKTHIGRIPGRVIEVINDKGSVVLTGDGALLVTQVQLENAGILPAAEILKSTGQTLG